MVQIRKYSASYNSRLGIWSICHNDWCERGETSKIAQVLTSLDDAEDEKTAILIVNALNAYNPS